MGDLKNLVEDKLKELQAEVKCLISEIDKTHKYSMSRIYGLYNKVFNTNETPQSCASCLIRKTEELRKWIAEQYLKEDEVTSEKKTKTKTRKK